MNPEIEKAIAPVTTGFYALAIAVVLVAIVAAVAAKSFGGKTKRQRQATAKLLFALGILVFAFAALPKILGH